MARKTKDDEMRGHYDFSGGVRGKYAARYAEGTHVVLARDVAEVFPDSAGQMTPRTLVLTSGKKIRVEAASKRCATKRTKF